MKNIICPFCNSKLKKGPNINSLICINEFCYVINSTRVYLNFENNHLIDYIIRINFNKIEYALDCYKGNICLSYSGKRPFLIMKNFEDLDLNNIISSAEHIISRILKIKCFQ